MKETMNLDKDKSKLTEAWDQVADALEYDPMRPVRYKKCIRYLSNLNRESRIVEIGCGEGSGLRFLKNLGFKDLIGIEVSIERLRRAKSKLGRDTELILISPSGTLPVKDQSVDAVISAGVIEHVIDPRFFIQEIARIVRLRGYVVISSDCYSWYILQLLGIYRSIQPIDRALFPTTLFRYFKESGLQLLHYEGFSSCKFRFLRLLIGALLTFPKRVAQRLIPNVIIQRIRRFAGYYQTGFTYKLQSDRVLQNETIAFEPWSPNLGLWSFLKVIFSDENVFFLTKRETD